VHGTNKGEKRWGCGDDLVSEEGGRAEVIKHRQRPFRKGERRSYDVRIQQTHPPRMKGLLSKGKAGKRQKIKILRTVALNELRSRRVSQGGGENAPTQHQIKRRAACRSTCSETRRDRDLPGRDEDARNDQVKTAIPKAKATIIELEILAEGGRLRASKSEKRS